MLWKAYVCNVPGRAELFLVSSCSGAVMHCPRSLPSCSCGHPSSFAGFMFRSCYPPSLGLLRIPRWCHSELFFSTWALDSCTGHVQSAFPSSPLAGTTRQQKASCCIWHYVCSIRRNSLLGRRNVTLAWVSFHELLQIFLPVRDGGPQRAAWPHVLLSDVLSWGTPSSAGDCLAAALLWNKQLDGVD